MPWHHHCMACCGKFISRDISVPFLYISPKPALRSWTWLYRQKANKTTFPTISCPYRNSVNFSHTSRIHFSTNSTSFCPFKPMGLRAHRHTGRHTDTQKWKQYILGGYKYLKNEEGYKTVKQLQCCLYDIDDDSSDICQPEHRYLHGT